MSKPTIIQNIEQEFKCSFRLEAIEQIHGDKIYIGNEPLYAINQDGDIIAISMCSHKLYKIPEVIGSISTLTVLHLAYNFLDYLHVLSNLKNLEKLILNNNEITNIEQLSELKQLNFLLLQQNCIKDLTPLHALTNLNILEIAHNPIEDFSPIKKLPLIKKPLCLYIIEKQTNSEFTRGYFNNSIFSHKRTCYTIENEKLNGLSLYHLKIEDISFLEDSEFKDLKKLSISFVNMGRRETNLDLSPLLALKNLEELYFGAANAKDILPISYLKTLKLLDLRGNFNFIELPEWICDFPLMEIKVTDSPQQNYITFINNQIQNVPIEIIEQGKKAIKDWFHSKKNN